MLTDLELQKIAATAEQTARRAGAILMRHFNHRGSLAVEHKGEIDLVTAADRESEELIRSELQKLYPDFGLLGEEEGGKIAADRPSWIIDPLDGTTNFTHRYPFFSISIALVEPFKDEQETDRFEPIVGCVYAPALAECFTAAKGGGARLNGRAIEVSHTTDLKECMLCTGFPYDLGDGRLELCLEGFAAFLKRSQAVRRDGSAALDLAYVAMGRFDGFFEIGIKAWDVAGGLCLVNQAGGRTTSYTGGFADVDGRNFVASNARIHDEMLAVLRETYGEFKMSS